MRGYILGCGTPTPTAERYGSSYVLQLGDQYVMFDCGPATTYKLVKAGLVPTRVDYLFFTHHHFDHDVDYPAFLLTRWDQSVGREAVLQVFGPRPTEALTRGILDEKEGIFAHDWIARVNHPLSLNAYRRRGGVLPRKPPVVHARDVGPGQLVRGKDWEVRAAPAEHVQPWLDSLAHRVDSSQGSVVITGDTRPCASVVELARGADVMLCVCVFVQEDIDGTPEADAMCGSTAAARMAQEAGVGTLVLVHQSQSLEEPGNMERALRDIGRVYDGRVVWGRELLALDL
ncbi:MAG TPA: MBL fold metallo-hydrolase [Methylomirabilota bacterium]|nr:MBL fold metallo-hydrolase [Methylomirabilota bacterium]